MYNAITEKIIREIPQIGNIDTEHLPQELTKIFARIISLRKTFVEEGAEDKELMDSLITLRTLTNNLETILIVNPQHENKESLAFVSATSHYLQLKINNSINESAEDSTLFLSDTIAPVISTIILFLIANSQADAAEVATHFVHKASRKFDNLLYSYIKALALGNLAIFSEAPDLSVFVKKNLSRQAEYYLWENILLGIRALGLKLMGQSNETDYFQKVIELSVFEHPFFKVNSTYNGPLHLAKLLKILEGDILKRGLINTPCPSNLDVSEWTDFLKSLAEKRPYLWENHYEAVESGFINPGFSAILTFPTGAGKSTISELKIGATLLSGKKVVYLVPTHALKDQINNNFQNIFKNYISGADREIDSEYTDLELTDMILVMTPERCITLLGVNEDAFNDVGLIVFDEFHLIHGKDNKRDRRSIDAMFCLLLLFNIVPDADYLLISAMVENSEEIAEWIAKVTGRPCLNFNSSWKPTRQMLGCLIFQEDEIKALDAEINKSKNERKTKAPGTILKKSLRINPYIFYSLRNIWESVKNDDYHISPILDHNILLKANQYWKLTPNRNEVAADLAIHFGLLGIKTLVFVDTPSIANSTARRISDGMTSVRNKLWIFKLRNRKLIRNLQLELGDLKYSFLSPDGNVGVHHGLMLSMERQLNELSFKDNGGITTVVATATLAQGINLPAEIVIIAGDDRYDEIQESRQRMPPHELLNAAGRAGRAGMSSQGAVFLIPGEIVTVKNHSISERWWTLKKEVFSKSDQCLIVNDPLEYFLDTMAGVEPLELTEKNILFRLKPEILPETQIRTLFNNSFYAFNLDKAGKEVHFEKQVEALIARRNDLEKDTVYANWVKNVSIKTGIDPFTIEKLGEAIDADGIDEILELDVVGLLHWFTEWLAKDEENFINLFNKEYTLLSLFKVLGLKKTDCTIKNIIAGMDKIENLLLTYIRGNSYEILENIITSKPDPYLANARSFVLRLVPDISFAFGLFSLTIVEKMKEDANSVEIPITIKVLASCIREGFDESDKLFYKYNNPEVSRVATHLNFEY